MKFRFMILMLAMTAGLGLCRSALADSEIGSLNPAQASQEPGRDFLPAAMTQAGVDEHLNQELPLDLVFRDDQNQMVRLGDLFGSDKPVILSLNYSNCPMLCVLQLNGLVKALKDVDLVAGQDFRLISVSLDPRETVEQAALTKKKYLEAYGKAVDESGWNFLVGNETAVSTLAQAVGIRYVYLPEKKEYSHPAVFCVCMPEGRISRYHYGIEFPPQTIRLSLVEASEGKIGNAFDRFLLLCFHYDDASGRYAPTARNLMKAGGVAVIVGIGLLFWACQKVIRRRKRIEEMLAQGQVSAV